MKEYKKVNTEDDFLNNMDTYSKTLVAKKKFATSLEDVDNALSWYEHLLQEMFSCTSKELSMLSITFTELYMNAYEHGNLTILAKTKQQYLQEDTYFDKLQELEQECEKKISVGVYNFKKNSLQYIATEICDEGRGFNMGNIDFLYKNLQNFNGRGIFLSRKNCLNLYYNNIGNCVLFFNKCETVKNSVSATKSNI